MRQRKSQIRKSKLPHKSNPEKINPVSQETPDYSRQWQDYQMRQILSWLTLIGGPILLLSLGQTPHTPKALTDCLAVCWIVGVFVLSAWSSSFKCPRCGNPFISRKTNGFSYWNGFTSKCLNCGLPKWANHP